MPFKCCVPNCKGNNYATGPKVSTFAFPKDENLRGKWIQAIKRIDFIPTNTSKVCELHFAPGDIERSSSFFVEKTGELLQAPLKRPRLVIDAVPSKLPGCPAYLSKTVGECPYREQSETKRQKVENQMVQTALRESIAEADLYEEENSIKSLDHIFMKFEHKNIGQWILTRTKQNNICFILMEEEVQPRVQAIIYVNEHLYLSIFHHDVEIKAIGTYALPLKIGKMNTVEDILEQAKEQILKKYDCYTLQESHNMIGNIFSSLATKLPEKTESINFLKEQVKLLIVTSKNALRYSWETLLFCSLLHAISPHAYKFLRSSNNLVLPSPSTLKKICSELSTDPRREQSDDNFLQYVAAKISLLDEKDKLILLMVDEIHLKAFMDYKGGNVVGGAYNSTSCATSAHVFMISSLLSSYKEVVHILPVKTLQANDLNFYIKKVVMGLEKIGFEVLIIVTDNNAINRKAISMFSDPPLLSNKYHNPSDPSRPLFYVIDPVHIFKNLRNNWINHKPCQQMVFPNFDEGSDSSMVASFEALKELHARENTQLLKYSYTLSLKALYPTSMERQNVKLVCQIFNQNIVAALRELGPKLSLENFKDTAVYIEILTKWWNMVNVKTPLKGKRLRNPFQEPLTRQSKHIYDFLNNLLNWLKKWELQPGGGKLSPETHLAITHTTDAFLKISKYCFDNKNFNYILLGKIQTDDLEARFRQYRLEAGAQYHISIRQVYETEKKVRIKSVVPIVLKSKAFGTIEIRKEDLSSFFEANDIYDTNVQNLTIPETLRQTCGISEYNLDDISDLIWPSIIYVAGYGLYSLLKKIKCDYCKEFLTENEFEKTSQTTLISINDRGGLSYPSEHVALSVAYTYLTIQNILKDENTFLKQRDQRKIIVVLTLEIISALDLNLFFAHNCQKHSKQYILKILIFKTTNVLLKNYSKKRNDTTTTKTMPQLKRIKASNNVNK